MKQRAVIVAPGRGTYNRAELGYLQRLHADKSALLRDFDAYRASQGQEALSSLDGAARYSVAKHTRGDNASALIHACALFDFLSIDRERIEIVGVTGNSMGWYIALTCAGVLGPREGLKLVNTMGTLMQEHMIGGQIIHPFVDDDWQPIPGRREEIEARVAEIDARKGHDLALSIDLGGMLVLAGNAAGLDAFEAETPVERERFPMRLHNHAAFHTALQEPVAAQGRKRLPPEGWAQPDLPLIDGRGGFWWPKASDISALWDYTLGHQVVRPYDFSAAIRSAARELMPDLFIVLGPGSTLMGAVAQSLVRARWRGWQGKADFKQANTAGHCLVSMGDEEQRRLVLPPA